MLASVVHRMAEVGWGLCPVLGDHQNRPFAYTCGFTTAFNLPEVVLVGLEHPTSTNLLDALGARMRDMPPDERATAFEGRLDGVVMGYQVGFRRLGSFREVKGLHTTATILGRRDFDVVQVLFPDREDRLPDDPACTPGIVTRQAWPPTTGVLPLLRSRDGGAVAS